MPKKSSPEGGAARTQLLREHGLQLADSAAMHDQLDAALCAWLGWTLFHQPDRVALIGQPCLTDDGVLREGGILQLAARSDEAIRD